MQKATCLCKAVDALLRTRRPLQREVINATLQVWCDGPHRAGAGGYRFSSRLGCMHMRGES
eukprot:357381-Chlamydomonas_euryale.AAC.3